ncbi:MAG TPA: Clp protease N-terminal domain-containing protein [Streptosporangiaceae bacterium]
MDQLPARLDDLIDYVKTRHPGSGPLTHLSAAVLAAEQLGELADHLIGHFVDQARRAGASWTEIGQSMGVSKQAAQKRFVPKSLAEPGDRAAGNLFSRFTIRARGVAAGAQEEAREARHDHVASEHIVLGLLREPEGLAAKAIEGLGVSLDGVRDAVVAAMGPAGADEITGHIPFAPEAKKVLELSVRDALRLGHNYVGTEHILLGVLGLDDGLGARVLGELGITKTRAEEWLIPVLTEMLRERTEAADT